MGSNTDADIEEKAKWYQRAPFKEYKAGEHVPLLLIPLKNRWFRGVIYVVTVLCTTCIYFGWQNLALMLFEAKYYDHLCNNDYEEGKNWCKPQYSAVQNLFIVSLVGEFSGSLPAGVLYTYLGPAGTAIVGEIMFFLGWTAVIFSTKSFPLYIPGMLFSALSINLVAFPALVLADLFPHQEALSMGLVVAAQTASSGIAPLLEIVWKKNPSWKFRNLFGGYLLFVCLPLTILYILSLPISRNDVLADTKKETEDKVSTEAAADESMPLQLTPVVEEQKAVETTKLNPSVKVLLKEMWSIRWILFTVYYIIQTYQIGYYPTCIQVLWSEKFARHVGYMMPAQAITGVVIGFIAGYTKTVPMCVALNIMACLVFALSLVKVEGLQYFTVINYILAASYIYTTKYTFCAEVFPPSNFGMLCGITGFISGLTSLALLPLGSTPVSPVIISLLVVGGVQFVILFFLFVNIRGLKGQYSPPALEGGQDVSAKSTVEMKDVPAESTVEMKDVPAKSTVEMKDVPAESTVEMKDVPAESTVEMKDVPAESNVEMKDVSIKQDKPNTAAASVDAV